MRLGTDEREQRGTFQSVRLVCLTIFDVDRLHERLTVQVRYVAVRQHLDTWMFQDAIAEIRRHAFGQIAAPDQQLHFVRLTGQKHGGLPRRISTANHDSRCIFTDARFDRSSRVVNACSFETFEAWYIELPIGDTTGHQDAPAREPSDRCRVSDDVDHRDIAQSI